MTPEIGFALVGAVVAGYVVFRFLRQRIKRRHKAQFDLPDFLSGRPNAGDDAGGDLKTDWLEIHPGPRRRTKGED